jgi:hypothetical protein
LPQQKPFDLDHAQMAHVPLTAAEIEDERALVDSYGMLGKGIQEAIEIHNSRLAQMRRAVS